MLHPKRKSFLNYEPQFIRVLIISEPNEVLLSLKLLTQVSFTFYCYQEPDLLHTRPRQNTNFITYLAITMAVSSMKVL